MRVRAFELRVLAAILTSLWIASSLIVLFGYRPGGPADLLVGVAACLPLPISLAAVIWPPVDRSTRVTAGIVWIGIVAVLLLIPSIVGVTLQVLDRSTAPLLPSLEVVYPWLIALVATSFFAGVGITRAVTGQNSIGRRRFGASLAFALGVTAVVSVAFAGVSFANDAALRDRPARHSRFGPTAATPEPPSCDGTLEMAATAHVELDMNVRVDETAAGDLHLAGVRSGSDASWTADVVKPDLAGRYGAVRLRDRGWTLAPGSGWTSVPLSSLSSDLLDQTAIDTILTPGNRETAEERGVEFVEGARARHCRVSVDGTLFAAGFPQVRLIVGDANIASWRGQVDYWIFGDGEVGKVSGTVNGQAAGILPHGLQATTQATLIAVDRNSSVTVSAPR